MQKQLQNKTVSTNFFSLKGGEFDLFEFTMLFHKHLCSFASSRQIPKTSKTLAKTFGNFQKRKCSPVEKTFCWDCWKTSCTWSWKTTSNFTSKRSHQKLIPNSFAVQIASSANEFHRKRSSSPKSWCQTSSSKNNQISMLLYPNSDVFTSFCIISRVLSNRIVKNIKS